LMLRDAICPGPAPSSLITAALLHYLQVVGS
jgi:hypothetical protein